ncbi:hypothetical protein DICA4_D15104 [Diutina catenulata]
MAEPAPYTGPIVAGATEANEREAELATQRVDVTFQGVETQLRPEALHLQGVDRLSTDDIKGFVNYYINFTPNPDDQSPDRYIETGTTAFKIEWINDSSANVAFDTHASAAAAHAQLAAESVPAYDPATSIASGSDYVAAVLVERPCKAYTPVPDFVKTQSLAARLDAPKAETGMDEDASEVELRIRQSVATDAKVKQAAQYSRYYLLHGEPTRYGRNNSYRPQSRERNSPTPVQEDGEEIDFESLRRNPPASRERQRGRRGGRGGRERVKDDGDDLFAHKMSGGGGDAEDDLFADRLRERSPGRGGTNGGRFRERSPERRGGRRKRR